MHITCLITSGVLRVFDWLGASYDLEPPKLAGTIRGSYPSRLIRIAGRQVSIRIEPQLLIIFNPTTRELLRTRKNRLSDISADRLAHVRPPHALDHGQRAFRCAAGNRQSRGKGLGRRGTNTSSVTEIASQLQSLQDLRRQGQPDLVRVPFGQAATARLG